MISSSQCVWFINLGPLHQQPVTDWFRKQQSGLNEESGCMLSNSVSELPRLVAAPKISPAERRWRKKQAADLSKSQDGVGGEEGETTRAILGANHDKLSSRKQQQQQQRQQPQTKQHQSRGILAEDSQGGLIMKAAGDIKGRQRPAR